MPINRNNLGSGIDRSRPFRFKFNGLELEGYHGDTLASALLANNIHLVARSIKYHRPRGILSAGLEEPSAMVECSGPNDVYVPNQKVTEIPLRDGLIARSQNCWPSVAVDIGTIFSLGSNLMPAGFYYKTFKWPRWAWYRIYEKFIRRMAGHGQIRKGKDATVYDERYIFCQILVIGSGPAGLCAALTAARAGAKVVVLEQDTVFGGSLLWQKEKIESKSPESWLSNVLTDLECRDNVLLMPRTLGFGQYDHGLTYAIQNFEGGSKSILWRIRSERIILAAGAVETPIVFSNNDRPGIMLAGSVRQYIYRYGVSPGRRAFLAISDSNELAATAKSLDEAGIEIVGSLKPGERLISTKGKRRVQSVMFYSKDDEIKEKSCDLMCVSSGWVPVAHLAAHMGSQSFPSPNREGYMLTAGACRGLFSTKSCTLDGTYQANQALKQLGLQNTEEIEPADVEEKPDCTSTRHCGTDKAFVDFQNDVTRSDLFQALQEGFDDVELVKRYTTTGMGTDQGKTSWANAISEISNSLERTPQEIGLTTFRPPYSPVRFGALAGVKVGQNMVPIRQTPFHRAFENLNCVFQTSGNWHYSRYFPRENETMQQTIHREVLAVRRGVGVVDMSSLGKFEVKGKDALEFLSRIYCNNISQIEVGRVRYGLMLREDGVLYDDGTVARLGNEHFYVTTTTANAGSVWKWMTKLLQFQWPELDVRITAVTDQWATIAVAGPYVRELLLMLEPDFDITTPAFPFASVRQGYIGDTLPCRVFSISYSGELSYEINVPAGYANCLLDRIQSVGKKFDVTPYGLEALDVLRIEKGHLAIGTEIDGRTTPQDLGLSNMVSTSKEFIGRALLLRPSLQNCNRLQLVGVTPVDKKTQIPAGGHLVESSWSKSKIQKSQGRVTASVYSPTLEYPIALALLGSGFKRTGEHLWVVSPIANKSVKIVVGPTCFYDAEGKRLHG